MPIKNIEQRKSYQKKYQKTHCRKSRKEYLFNKSFKLKSFLCFDGETESNLYTLLGNSVHHIYNKRGLKTKQCLDFLWNEGKFQNKIKIVFSIHFDVQFWIRNLSDKKIIELFDGEEINYLDYKLFYIPKRFLKISKGKAPIYIYDVSSFFQSSLLYTIERMKIKLSDSEKKILYLGKEQRKKNFKGMNQDQIIDYNKTECIVTEKICDKLQMLLFETEFENKLGEKFNLIPKRFYGSGAIAKKILQQMNIKELSNFEKLQDEKIREIIYKTYFGGRAEIFKIGTFKNVYKYDINSAYPDHIRKLRIPKSFKLYKVNKTFRKYDFADDYIYEIETDFSIGNPHLIGVLPYRLKSGYVMYPKRVSGFYFGIEAKHLNNLCSLTYGNFTIKRVLEIHYRNEKVFPEGFIENIYDKRIELKEKGDVSEIVYKLALNSIYGKLAQQTGYNEFTIILFASFITASTRALILKTIFENNLSKDLLQISTDAIFTTKEIRRITINKELGNFSKKKYNKAVILGSGVYALYNKTKSEFSLRGFEVSENNFNSIYTQVLKTNIAEIRYKSFIGHKIAIAQYNAFGNKRLTFAEITKSVQPFEYQKRKFLKKNKISGISKNYWIDIFPNDELPIESAMLKKFESDLFNEIVEI